MSDTQATNFANTYSVVDQFTDPLSGFSATIFDKGGVKYFAIRGTETKFFSGTQDWLTNVLDVSAEGIAIRQGLALFNYLQRLQGAAGNSVTQYVYDPLTRTIGNTTGTANGFLSGQQVSVTGHSLGGHLAMLMSRLAPGMVNAVFTYNAPGFDTTIRTNLFPLTSEGFFNALRAAPIGPITGQIGTSWNSGIMVHLNVEGDVVHDIGNTPGIQQFIFSESANQGVFNAHDKVPLTDSLAIYNLFATLDPDLNSDPNGLATLTGILKAASNKPSNSLENTLDSLRKLFQVNGWQTKTTIDDRQAYYTNLFALRDSISQNGVSNLTLISLLVQDASTTLNNAQASDDTGLATRYALKELNPFVLSGNTVIYAPFGEALKAERFSNAYLTDRVAFLYNLRDINIADSKTLFGRFLVNTSGEKILFSDLSTRTQIFFTPQEKDVPSNTDKRVIFGSDAADNITGQANADRLYGGDGNDTLSGNDGNDYLEGNLGNDRLYGGVGNDTYVYLGKEGNDTIIDSDGFGKILYSGRDLSGAKNQVGNNTELFNDGTYSYRFLGDLTAGGVLTITKDGDPDSKVTVENFKNGNLGITLNFLQAASTPIDRTIVGDLARIDFEPDPGIQVRFDDIGNVITDPGQPEPDRADFLNDSASNDRIESGGGVDTITAFAGGDDHILSGTGNDGVSAGPGNDVVEAGPGSDNVNGGFGDDRLFADTFTTFEDAVANGNVAGGAARGDLLAGSDGIDTIVGGADRDFLTGGAGDDRIAGGGGDDIIESDVSLQSADASWAATLTVMDNTFTVNHLNMILDAEGEGDDVVYAGGGDDYVSAGAGDDFVDGGSGADVLFGEAGADAFFGGEGNDIMTGDNSTQFLAESLHGDDFLDGGAGNDQLFGDGGNDTLFGGEGNDQLFGDTANLQSPGDDYLDGEAGDDLLVGAGGADTLYGGEGNDTLAGDSDDTPLNQQADDELFGEDGNDRLQGYGGNDILDGGAGDDTLLGGVGENTLLGGDGNDFLQGEDGNDTLDGGAGDDTLLGGASEDTLLGGEGNDLIVGDNGGTDTSGDADFIDGGAGNDQIDGQGGDDVISGDEGDDVLFGGKGDDVLDGGDGNDQLQGEEGNDTLIAGEGNDVLFGEAGNDQLDGGAGADLLQGGAGDDTYLADGSDTISDNEGNNHIILNGFNDVSELNVTTSSDGQGQKELIVSAVGATETIPGIPDGLHVKGDISTLNFDFQFDNGTVLTPERLLTAAFTQSLSLVGGAGDDVLKGFGGDDILNGQEGNDTLIGGAGNDQLFGGDGNDNLHGDTGDDTLTGGIGSDTYFFARGDGRDIIADAGTVATNTADLTNTDIIQFAQDILASDVTLTRRANGDLILAYGNGDQVTVQGQFNNAANRIERIVFGDGSAVTSDFLNTLPVAPIVGTEQDDTLTGTPSDETLMGLGGNDAYTFGAGMGRDTWIDTGANTIALQAGFDFADVTTSQVGNDLLLTVGSSRDGALIKDYFLGNQDWTLQDVSGATQTLAARIADEAQQVFADKAFNQARSALKASIVSSYLAQGYQLTGADELDQGFNFSQPTAFYGGGESTTTSQFQSFPSGVISNLGSSHLVTVNWDTNLVGGSHNSASLVNQVIVSDDAFINDNFSGTSSVQNSIQGTVNVSWLRPQNLANQFSTVNTSRPVISQPEPGFPNGRLIGIVTGTITQHNFSATVDGQAGAFHPNGIPSSGAFPAQVRAFLTETHETNTLGEIDAGDSSNTIFAGANTVVKARGGDDTITGGYFVDGGAGDDVITGANIAYGGPGNDVLTGLGGTTTFLVNPSDTGNDTISDQGGLDKETFDDLYYNSIGIGIAEVRLRRFAGGRYLDIFASLGEFRNKAFDTPEEGRDFELQFETERLQPFQAQYQFFLEHPDAINDPQQNPAGLTLQHFRDIIASQQQQIDDLIANYRQRFIFVEPLPPAPDVKASDYAALEPFVASGLIEADTVQFGEGLSPNDVTVRLDPSGNFLNFSWDENGNIQVALAGDNDLIGTGIERYQFADSTVWSTAEAIRRAMQGTAGNDVLFGSAGNDILTGGAGNDTLIGGAGADTYVFNLGDGVDHIQDSSGTNSLLFGEGITPDSVSLGLGSLLLRVGDQGDAIHIDDFDPNNVFANPSIANFQFDPSPGSGQAPLVLSYNDLIAKGFDLTGTAGDDIITGTNVNDRINGLGGNDSLNGGAGNNTYIFDPGFGRDVVVNPSNQGSIQFTNGIAPGDITVSRDGLDLLFTDKSGNQVRISDWYADANSSPIQQAIFADGTVWDAATLDSKATAVNDAPGLILTGSKGKDTLRGGAGNDLLDGGKGNDVLKGDGGNDILEGGDGKDVLKDKSGKNLLNAGAGDDSLTGGGGNELYIGGKGDDSLTTGKGKDIIAFNRGDGKDTLNPSGGAGDTLSLGGGIRYKDLALSKNSKDLIVEVGNGEKIILKDWYASSKNKNVLNLQVITDAMAAYDPNSLNPLLNKRVNDFDFTALVDKYDQARAKNKNFAHWSVMNSLLDAHLAASDSEALGGDLAYQYGKNGTLAGIGLGAAQDVLNAPQFGAQAQTLRPLATLQEGAVKLS